MLNRQGLDILIHPLTDDEYEDHTANALWLGRPVRLHLGTLPHTGYRARTATDCLSDLKVMNASA